MPFKETTHTQNLVVALRVRPLSSSELGEPEIIHVLDENLVVLRDPYEDQDDILRANRSREKQYVFDHAFGPNASQVDVFSVTTKPLIHNVVSGYNATVFAYGATGAGKTYTMLGNDRKLGIMGLTLNDLFAEMEMMKEDVKYKVTMSYLEIYNEMIRDLLNPSTGILELREDAKGVNVTGLSEVEAKTTSEVMGMLLMGNKQRTSEPTAANKTSSRSHAILQVTVKQKSRVENVIQEVKVGKLFMIDLAGSERAAQTKNRGKRMIEGAHINRSLLALGNCINALSENRGHYVNFRDSKLTRLLKDSLGGNCKTVMIAHVSPAGKGFEESRNTLLYADRAKNIKTTIKKNQFNVSYHIAQYTNIITDLRKEIFRLKTKIAEQSVSEIDSNKTTLEEPSEHSKHKDHTEMNRIRNQLVSTFREQMEIRHKLMELEDMAMQIALDTNRYMLVIDEWEQEKVRRAAKNAEMEKERNEKESEQTDRHVYRDHDSKTLVDKNGKPAWEDKDEDEDDTNEDLSDRSNSYEDVENKDLDREKDKKIEVVVHESEPFSMAEPEDVTFAREEINNLIAEEKKVSEMKTALQSKLQQTRKEVERLEEQLPKKISSEENREILSLICKVHELEITNAELQSQALLRENILRYKDLEVSKYESRQKLCDEIIQMQRAVITDAQVNCPTELEGLYEVYLQQSSETDERDSLNSSGPESTTSSAGPQISVNRAAILAGINRRMTSRENLFTFTSKLSPLTEETPSRLVSLQNSPTKTSRPTPSTYNTFMENALAESSPTSPAHTPKYRSHISSPDDISIRSSLFLTTPKKPNNDTENHAPLTPVFSKTQKFTDLSTRRRIMMENGLVSSGSLREDLASSKMSSLVSVREKERDRPMASVSDTSLEVNSNKQAVNPSLSLGDLSMIDKKSSDQVSVDSVPVTRRRIAKKGKSEQGKISTPTRPTKRQRSASLDDAKVHRVKPRRTRKSQQEASKLHRPKHQFPSKIRERVSLGLEASSLAGNPNSKRSNIPKAPVHFNDIPRGVARSKDQTKQSRIQSNDVQDGELQTFVSNVTPTSSVRQIGTPPGKGLTIQRRYRAPSDITGSDSNQSTPRVKPRKQQSVGNPPVDALSVSGVAMRPTKPYAGIRRF